MLNLTHSDERRNLYSLPEAKVLEVKTDCILGKHYHKHKTEVFVLSQGSAYLQRKNVETGIEDNCTMEIGRMYFLLPFTYHEFHIKTGSILIGLNSQPFTDNDDYKL